MDGEGTTSASTKQAANERASEGENERNGGETNCNDPMHNCSVVVSTFGELSKVLAGLREKGRRGGKEVSSMFPSFDSPGRFPSSIQQLEPTYFGSVVYVELKCDIPHRGPGWKKRRTRRE